MTSSPLRTVLCAFVGLFAGTILGFLFVRDPTGIRGPVLAAILSVIIGAGLYRSDWRRGEGDLD